MELKLTNTKIVQLTNQLSEVFQSDQDFPVKVIFYIQKNHNLLMDAAKEIEAVRLSILQQYGELDEEGQYYILKDEFKEIAAKKLIDLGNIEQKLDIYTLSLADLKDISLTKKEMEALMFMVQEY